MEGNEEWPSFIKAS